MALSKKPYKGTRDFFPAQRRAQDYIFKKMEEVALLFGYEPYDGPLLEEVDLYKAKSGEELINEQIYSFTDRGDRHVAIRPEMTPTLARMVARIHKEHAKPLRWFSIPNLMRYEKPQRGRLREHWQFNCDIFGAPDRLGEIEILQVAIHLMNGLGADNSHFEILLNDREIVDTVFERILKLDKDDSLKLYKIVDKSKKISKATLDEMIGHLKLSPGKNEILNDYLKLSSYDEACDFLMKNGQEEISSRMSRFSNKLVELKLLDYIKYDPTIVRGLDYYTGIVFEIFDKHPDNRRAICGGGAYADLLKIFNESPLPGVGFGMGDVVLTDFLQVHNLMPDFTLPENDIFITFQDKECEAIALSIASKLRHEGIKTVTHLRPLKIKKVFPLAENKGARFVGLIGSQEIENGTIEIKNISTRESFSLKVSNISEIANTLRK